jgi:lipid-A-disaccharide synthase
LIIGKDVFLIPKEHTYNLMKTSYAAIAKSGTVTLELALHACPTVVSYQLTPLNRFLAKRIFNVNLPYYCIVNLLANRQVFPELIETKPSVEKLHSALHALIYDEHTRQHTISGCRQVNELLGSHQTSLKAAQSIEELL